MIDSVDIKVNQVKSLWDFTYFIAAYVKIPIYRLN